MKKKVSGKHKETICSNTLNLYSHVKVQAKMVAAAYLKLQSSPNYGIYLFEQNSIPQIK